MSEKPNEQKSWSNQGIDILTLRNSQSSYHSPGMEEAVLVRKGGPDMGHGAWAALRMRAGHHSRAVRELDGSLDTE